MFQALYGSSPRQLGIDSSSACSVTKLEDWVDQRNAMQSLIHQQLSRAKIHMKNQADKNRTKCSFEVGTWVYLKLQPYVQSSVAARSTQKLFYRFFGPYQIISKINHVAYKLELPSSSAIHPVFHVSQLKLAVLVTHAV